MLKYIFSLTTDHFVWRIGKSKFGLDMLLADTVLCINGNLTMYETSDVSHTFSGAVSIDTKTDPLTRRESTRSFALSVDRLIGLPIFFWRLYHITHAIRWFSRCLVKPVRDAEICVWQRARTTEKVQCLSACACCHWSVILYPTPNPCESPFIQYLGTFMPGRHVM
jgi:hypothetical protein